MIKKVCRTVADCHASGTDREEYRMTQDLIKQARLLQEDIRQYICHLEAEEMDVTEWAGQQADIAGRIHELAEEKTTSDEAEAEVCIAALLGFGMMIRDQKLVDRMVRRARRVLKRLPVSALRCRLLVLCFGETFDEAQAEEAHRILAHWPAGEPAELKVNLERLLKTLEEDLALTMGYHMA